MEFDKSVIGIKFQKSVITKTKTQNDQVSETNSELTMTKRTIKQCNTDNTCYDPANGYTNPVNKLKTDGYVVLRANIGDLGKIRSDIDMEIKNFQEFKNDASDRYPLGGFSAYGNPSSFHNMTVRDIREKSYNVVSPLLSEYSPSHMKHMIIDRLLVRPPGRKMSKETWHRDEAATSKDDDVIFGGWINLNDEPSFFSCVPTSHIGVVGHGGFSKLDDDQKRMYTHNKVLVKIPPGYILVFNEKIVHEVLPTKNKHPIYRVFLGWRLTQSDQPLDNDLLTKLVTQAPIPLKSGQYPPMYAKLHLVNWKDRLEKYSENFDPKCTVRLPSKNGGETTVVDRHMKSLHYYGYKLYPSYSLDEVKKLLPH